MAFALKRLDEEHVLQILWVGIDRSLAKAVACAEVMKRRRPGLFQITKIQHAEVTEFYEPKLEGLERLKVVKELPAIAILLSKVPLPADSPGYQAPEQTFEEFWRKVVMPGEESAALAARGSRNLRRAKRNVDKMWFVRAAREEADAARGKEEDGGDGGAPDTAGKRRQKRKGRKPPAAVS